MPYNKTLEMLPTEIYMNIFSYLSLGDLYNIFLVGFSSLLITCITTNERKFIKYSSLKNLPNLRKVHGYIIYFDVQEKTNIEGKFFLPSFSLLNLSYFKQDNYTLITTNSHRCRCIEKKNDCLVLYNYGSYKRKVETNYKYAFEKGSFLVVLSNYKISCPHLVKIKKRYRYIFGNITSYDLLTHRFISYVSKFCCVEKFPLRISLKNFPLVFYEELSILNTRRNIISRESYLYSGDINYLLFRITKKLSPFEEAMLYSVTNILKVGKEEKKYILNNNHLICL